MTPDLLDLLSPEQQEAWGMHLNGTDPYYLPEDILPAALLELAQTKKALAEANDTMDWLESLNGAAFWKNKAGGTSFSPDETEPKKMRAGHNLRAAIDAAKEGK